MNSNLIELIGRRVAIVTLLGVVGVGLWRVSSDDADAFGKSESRLSERIDEYIALRMDDDQVAVYGMMDPAQRSIKDLQTYLEFHGRGVLKIIKMEPDNPRIDTVSQTAKVVLDTAVELVPSKLPPPFNDLDEEHPEHLRREGNEELHWVWRDGEWYVRMDRAFVTGKAPDGREIQSFGELQKQHD